MSESTPPTTAETEGQARYRACPFCKENVHVDATKCPYCQAWIDSPPDHGGECPLCKEEIHEEAVRCRHCKSDLGKSSSPINAFVYYSESRKGANLTGCRGCGSASSISTRALPQPGDPVPPGLRRYCFTWCPTDCPAG